MKIPIMTTKFMMLASSGFILNGSLQNVPLFGDFARMEPVDPVSLLIRIAP